MIKMIIFDLDGVVTDGTIIVDSQGNEQKKINLKDIDAIYELKKRGYLLAAITGEASSIVEYFKRRFPWDYFYCGEKNKTRAIQEIERLANLTVDNICYVGDGKYDIEPLIYTHLGICPADAINSAKNAADIILQNNCGQGCLWELIGILEGANNPDSSSNYFYMRLEEHDSIFKKMASDQELITTVMNIGDTIIDLLDKEGQIFLCGNGGSAADAQHIATEFISRFYKERPAMNAEALTTNTSTITAIGNDYSYEKIFVRQLEAKLRENDLLIAISTSGRSKNVLEALRYAKKRGVPCVIMMGDYDVIELHDLADHVVKIPSKITPRIQEAHIFLGHLIAEYVEHKKYGKG